MEIEIHELAELAAKYINTTSRNIFLTGKAGTGKTTFLKYIVENTYKNATVAAPTGIAAINAGGVTLHSLLHLPFGAFVPENITFSPHDNFTQLNTPSSVVSNSKFNATKRELLKELELLIIDEVSMLRADLLDCIDVTLRHVRRKKSTPFGGVQILFIGDLYQLPPVVKDHEWTFLQKHYSSSYFFDAQALKKDPPLYIELDKIYRQSDTEFIGILNRLRDNVQTPQDLALLNSHYQKDLSESMKSGYVYITTHNYKADKINEQELQKINEPSSHFRAKLDGDYPDNLFPLSDNLQFKVGAQVMFIKNDLEVDKRYFNGKVGRVTSMSASSIGVTCDEGLEIEVEPHQWENKRYTLNKDSNQIEEKVIGTFEQFPLRLAWAITVHKSQGLTFEKAILDLSGAFAPGQVYVALSRLTSLKGLKLSTALPQSGLEIDRAVTSFGSNKSDKIGLQQGLTTDRKIFLQELIARAFNFAPLLNDLNYHLQSFNKEETRSAKQQYLAWTKELINETFPLKETGDKFIRQANHIVDAETDYLPRLLERVTKAKEYFSPLFSGLSEKVSEHEKVVRARKKVKGYLTELKNVDQLFSKQNLLLTKIHLILESASQNKVLTKTDLSNSVPKKLKPEKVQKTPTRETSFEMYKKPMTVEEIANERNLVPGTIESHLSHYVGTGEIPVTDFIKSDKLEKILKVAAEVDYQTGQIKSNLGNDCSYTEIRFAMAHYNYTQSPPS